MKRPTCCFVGFLAVQALHGCSNGDTNAALRLNFNFGNHPLSADSSSSTLPVISKIRIVVTGENIPVSTPIVAELSTTEYEAYFEFLLPEGRNQIVRASAIAPDDTLIKTVSGYVTTSVGLSVTARVNIFTTPVAEVLDRLGTPTVDEQYLMPAAAIQGAVYAIIQYDAMNGSYGVLPSRIDIDQLEAAVRSAIAAATDITAITTEDILASLAGDIVEPGDGASGFDIDFGIPAVSMTADPIEGFVPLEVTFQAVATDFCGTLRQYKWDFESDGIWDSTAPNPVHTYGTDGTYQAVVDVRDNTGAAATTYLTINAYERVVATGRVDSFQKISDTEGFFDGVLDNSDRLGRSVAALGDFDGDGIGDVVVGAHLDDDGGLDRGAIYILLLNADGTVKDHHKISGLQGGFLGALDNSDYFGVSVTSLGDLDQDGVTDIAVGAHADDDGGTDRGAVYILFMDINGTVKEHRKISSTQGSFFGTLDNSDYFGIAVSRMNDINGDGTPELAVGAYGDDDGGTDRGAVYILFLEADGTVGDYRKISDTDGGLLATIDNSDQFGFGLASLGDVDGDGIGDLAVGAYGDDDGGDGRGAIYILFLDADSRVKGHQKVSDTDGDFHATLDNLDYIGLAVGALGDMNSDGVPDVAVGAVYDDDGGDARGAIYVLFLQANGKVGSYQKISDTDGKFDATLGNGDHFGVSLASIGDMNGDHVSELIVGADYDDDGGTDRGAAYVLFME